MEFINPILKQKHKKRLTVGYLLLTLLVGLATYILVATAMGYEILQRDGQIIQNGIVFLDSKPVRTEIFVNGKKESSKTDARLTLPEGDYEIILKADGYKDWTKRLAISGGKVSFINYPRLFPSDLKVIDLKAYEGKDSGLYTQSPDKRWILFQPDITKPEINIIDTVQINQPQQVISLPSQVLGAPNTKLGSLKIVEWASDNKHMLMQHTPASGAVTFTIIDREDLSKSVYLNTLLNVLPTKVSLIDGKVDQVYLYFASGGILRIGDMKSKTIGSQLFEQVLDFKHITNGRLMVITTKNSSTGKATVNSVDGDKTFLIGEVDYDPNGQYILEAAQFSGDWYYVVGSKVSEKVHVYKNPQNFADSIKVKSPNIFTTLRSGIPQHVGFSPQKRFILVHGAQIFSIYDTNTKTSYRINLPGQLDTGTTISWVNEFIVQYSIGGKLIYSEFDGKNSREMATIKAPYLGYTDESFKRLYTLRSINGVTTSQLTGLVLDT